MNLYREQGVVLRTWKLGEADRIVVFLTQGEGKVRAVAKGVRKTKSRFGGRLEPFSHVDLSLYRGRELDIVTQAEVINPFRVLREDYDRVVAGTAMLEAVDQVAQEREANPALYRMLVGALRTLAVAPSPMVAPAFFWKLLSLEGFHPILDTCTRCGDEAEPFSAFDFGEGGVLCGECARFAGRRVDADAIALLRRILGGDLRGALTAPPDRPGIEVERLGVAALEYHLERRLRSAALL